ncbi:glycerophosphoinositol inositolphosphodiesterase GDPD2 [Lithobates pipiens]
MARDTLCSSCAQCLGGLLSCSCRKAKKTNPTCECIWVLLIFLIFFFTMIWMYITLILRNDIHNFNEEIFRLLGCWQDWSVVFIIVAAILLSYCALLVILSMILVVCAQPLRLHWVHKVLIIFCAALVALGMIGLGIKWKIEWAVVAVSLQATSPFLHIGAVIGVSALAWVLAGYFWETKGKVLKSLVLVVYILLVCALFVSPIFTTSPCVIKTSELHPKPKIIGHRGAPMLAPENTMMSFQKMVESGGTVFETDVSVSLDGIPFLMHDATLLRTTNIKKLPEFWFQDGENCTNFTWNDLRKLNAGDWFLERNPFGTNNLLSAADQEEVKQQKIPSLEEIVNACKDRNISLIFDLRPPPPGHPYNESFVNVTVSTILNTSISEELILWLPDDNREEVIQRAPGFKQIFGRKRLTNDTLDAVNLSYTNLSVAEIRSYRKDNISVNLFVVNEPWLFSHLWCAGATSVTSNAFQLLKDMKRPIWLMDPDNYLIIWIVADVVALIHIVWAFVIQKKCLQRREEESETVLLMKIENLVS